MRASKTTSWDLWEVFVMANLLAEGYRRLFKGKRFYIVGIVLIGLTILLTFMYLMINKMMSSQDVEEFKMTADSLLMAMNGDMPLFIGITAGMLIVQDFRNNTIRNKVIIGHSRTNIYLANWIVSVSVMLIYMFAFYITVLIFGAIMLGFEEFPSTAIFVNMLHSLAIQLAVTSLIVFLCNTMKNIGGFVLSITMHYIVSMFSLVLQLMERKYPKLAELTNEAVPSLQMSIIQNYEKIPKHSVRMFVFMFAITIVSTVAGILLFQKSDLK